MCVGGFDWSYEGGKCVSVVLTGVMKVVSVCWWF